MTLRSLGTMVCIAALVAACGDDNSGTGGNTTTPPAGGNGGAGGVAGGNGGVGGLGGGNTIAYSFAITDFDNQPVDGAGVAVDLSDATRIGGLTNADGQLMLEVPAATDIAYIIAHKDGYSFISLPGALLGNQTQVGLSIEQATGTSTMVAVTGTASNMNDPVNDYLSVMASTSSTGFDEKGVTSYDIVVPPAEAFKLLAVDALPTIAGQNFTRVFHGIVLTDQVAITQPATINIDFNTAPPSTTPFSTSLALPADSVLASTGVAIINSSAPNLWAGGATSCTLATTQFDCDGELFDLAVAVNQTSYMVVEPGALTNDYGRSVQATTQGGPSVGLVDMDFPNPPDVTAPTGAGPHPVDTVAQFTVAAGGGTYDTVAANITSKEGRLIGIAVADQGELSIPPLPSTSDPATHYEASMNFMIFTCRNGPGGYCAAVGMQSWEASPPAN